MKHKMDEYFEVEEFDWSESFVDIKIVCRKCGESVDFDSYEIDADFDGIEQAEFRLLNSKKTAKHFASC